jgi:Domain of unknown function (DUF4166)
MPTSGHNSSVAVLEALGQAKVEAAPVDAQPDLRYCALLPRGQWAILSPAIQRRFSHPPRPGDTIVYRGDVVATELSRAGRLLANAARLIGAPLPLTPGGRGPALVAINEDPGTGGQIWTRIYARGGYFPQVIKSAKRFSGPTGLEEYFGFGISMALRLTVEEGALVFRSVCYTLNIMGLRLALPRWLSPGTCEVIHRDAMHGRFRFTLSLDHPLLGRLVHQIAFFDDAMPDSARRSSSAIPLSNCAHDI